jgi:hypothetical protein
MVINDWMSRLPIILEICSWTKTYGGLPLETLHQKVMKLVKLNKKH